MNMKTKTKPVAFKNIVLWTKPSSYAGSEFPDYYCGPGQHRDSSILEKCNFSVALDRLGGESKSVIVTRCGHWAVGWVEQILVHKRAKAKLKILDAIMGQLNDGYPVLDDSEYSDAQQEYLDETFDQFKDDFKEEVLKALGIEEKNETHPRRHLEQYLRELLQEDAGYHGYEEAYVCEKTVHRFAKYEYRNNEKCRYARLAEKLFGKKESA